MPESQNIEYKSSWRDDYLKWICGFANANGGRIFIGTDDSGNVIGIPNAQKLMEDIPNKVKDTMGILVDVNLNHFSTKDYLEIVVESYPSPVNYKGQYHYRSGSTKQELKGAALDKFMLNKKGKRWDGVPVPYVSVSDLKSETFDFFRTRALKSHRIEETALNDSNEQLIENLQLKENDYLKRAAILLFHPNPEKFVTGAYIKIGRFKTDDDLRFQDEIHGNLFEQIEKTMDLLTTKYMKFEISYEGLARIETPEYPVEAIREALLNAVSHKDYSGGVPIQIKVYDDKIIFWNEGQLPENWTVDTLLQQHPSKPFNPDISNAFFRCGYIESWGRGITKIKNECKNSGLPKPIYHFNEPDFSVEFRTESCYKNDLIKSGINERQFKAILFAKDNGLIRNMDYQSLNNVSKRTATTELTALVQKYNILIKQGTSGSGIIYYFNEEMY
ncbi:hypothetical protein MsAg5_08730 [Methanosarcinaceae archaeon Ag5]|uniref:Schlafen AlbA-2 domain-containing protein n=1 Tax=Methanolapillus africanus TaxID=3028297 RepID=A0AAE4MJJ5_9EURY|nr:hypothetical protein [Methanosarcinaceae archaeon Ag5]